MSGPDSEQIQPGDEVVVKAGRYEGRRGVVAKLLKDGGELAQVEFPGGSADYCLLTYLEKIEGSGSSQVTEKGGKK